GLKELARHGWQPLPALALATGLALATAFVHRQRRLAHPLLDLRLFGNRTFRSALTLFFVTALAGTGNLLLVTLYLQNVTGLAPLTAGLLLLIPNILMIIGNLATPALANRIRPAHLIAGGLLVASAGYTTFTLADATSGPQTIFIAMCIVMLGTAPLAALCNHLAMSAIPADKAGSGAAIVQTTTELGLGLGIATLATLGTTVYRNTVENALGSLPADVADAARESIDRAITAATHLPAEQAGDLLTAAREAFTSGIHVVGILTTVLYVGLAIVAVRTFRHVSDSNGGTDEPAKNEETDRAPASATATGA
ncbi:MAG TPA: MFS transporter, partial [Arthrobacter sp.]|nr:MFS transporter [Arthrobacter sp.]